ncbi:unnamed protein product [Lymnaea stagnalis]|uniref:Uncharacterized protein n=1 Tax=Lymnaea stagnalis TaxID=6523 RepID=A0AAV2HBR1_LYMST
MLELQETYFSILSTIIVITMASLFFCCWKRKTCDDAPDGKAKKQEPDKVKRGSSKKDQPQRPEKKPENGLVSPTQSSPTHVISGEDLGDFSAVQRETEILRSYRKPPPPKNRGRQSRAPRTAMQRSNENLDIFTELSEEDLKPSDINETLEVKDEVDASMLRSRPEESPKRDVRSSMLADIEQTLAALHTTEETKSAGDVRQSKDVSSSSEIEQAKDQTNEPSSLNATGSDEANLSTTSQSSPSVKPRQAPKVSPKPSPRARVKVTEKITPTAQTVTALTVTEREDSSGKEGSQSSRLEESQLARLEENQSTRLEESQSTLLEDLTISTATDDFNTTSASSTAGSQLTSLHSDNPITTSVTSSTKDYISGSEGISEEKSAVSSENVSPLPESSSESSHPAVTDLSTVSEEDSKDLSRSSENLNTKIPEINPIIILPTAAAPLEQDERSVASDRGDSVSSSILSAAHTTIPPNASPTGDKETGVKEATGENGNIDVTSDSITDADSRSTDLESSANTGSQMTSSLSVVLSKRDEQSEADTAPSQSIEILTKGEQILPPAKVESRDPSTNADLDEDGQSKTEEHSRERRESTEDQAGKGKHSKIPVRAGSKSRSSPPKATASK